MLDNVFFFQIQQQYPEHADIALEALAYAQENYQHDDSQENMFDDEYDSEYLLNYAFDQIENEERMDGGFRSDGNWHYSSYSSDD